ncbi:MAG: hypothetical protein HOD90_01555 [Nitrospina sp.]|nr:hypothetical protein [Nitrospina sp.]MBT3981696.1 hypothetical protein [Bacteriovoracaceae bacterium]MBT4258578.1 hypothetical protein [Nitrospina sp.]MBT4621572.1 hypothetical protein [Nitrospina sp.]
MNNKLTEKLFAEFPELYRGRSEPITENLMSFGFSCGDGWFSLIHELSVKITKHSKEKGLNPKAKQVKQKMGGLRFYLEGGDTTTDLFCAEAEKCSFTICEDCGASGKKQAIAGFTQTLCKKCLEGKYNTK